MLDYVNTNDSGNYVFGGRETTLPPALDVNSILDGTPGKAGLIQYVAERRQADSGSNGLGRLALTSDLSGTTISLSEEASGLPFGFKLASVSSTLSSVSSSGPSGTPNTVTLAFSGQPAADQAVTVTVGLPDGTSTDLTLKAATVSGTGAFVIGVDAVATAENFKNALSAALKTTTSTQLANASTIKASQDFFAGSTTSPPKRVALGPDGTAATASSYITDATANAANTVTWYQGTDAKASGDPRLDRVARISAGVTVGLGVRANESGIANSLAAVAASVVAGYSTSDEKLAQAQFADVRERSLKALSTANGQAQDIVIGLASSQTAIKSIDAERTATQSVIQTTLSSIEDASPEKTAAAITALETQLQATYQVTSKLLKLSLADYL